MGKGTEDAKARGGNGKSTGKGDQGEGDVLVAVIGNRNREVGVAALSLARPVLCLNQVSDNRQFETTLRIIRGYGATVVLFPTSHTQSALYSALVARSGAQVDTRPRRSFSEADGMEKIKQLSANELDQRDLDQRYLARAAAACLMQRVESTQQATFSGGALRVKLDNLVQGRLTMDAVTVRNLEVLANRRAALHRNIKNGCLLDFVDVTVTRMGHRTLRSELVSPPCELAVVVARQELVAELGAHPPTLNLLRATLAQLHDVDQLTSHYAVRPKKYTMATLKREADNTIRLAEVLSLLPQLSAQLQAGVKSALGRRLLGTLRRHEAALAAVLAAVDAKLSPTRAFQRSAEEQRIEAVYCVKPRLDGILDVARKTYSETVAAMKRYVAALNDEHAELEGSLHFSAKRGYFLRVPRNEDTARMLGALLLQPAFNKRTVACTTEALASLNLKQEQAAREALRRTEAQLDSLREGVRAAMGALFDVTDAVALLDVAQSFACFASQDDFVRPTMLAHGDLAIEKGRHIVVENALGDDEVFVANDVRLSDSGDGRGLAVVTGPNSAGKSTLLTQTALIAILAHAGCNVPAKSAKVPMLDRIFTRIGTEDNLEANASTFSLEMTEIAYILRAEAQVATRQLVLIDELGRGTSSREGLALAWAVAEFLQKRQRTFTLFATHFTELHNISATKVFDFAVKVDAASRALVHSHAVVDAQAEEFSSADADGNVVVPDYGIRLAEASGLPAAMIADAKKARETLQERDVSLQARSHRLQVLVRDARIMTTEQLRQALCQLAAKQTTTAA